MTKLTLEQVYEKIPLKFRNEVSVVSYESYNKMILKTKYGLVRISMCNLEKLQNFSIKSALDKTEFFKNMLLEKFPNYEQQYTVAGQFIRSNEPILVNSKYGNHLIKPDILLKGALPHSKNAINQTEYYINYFNDLHNNKYTYPDYIFCGSNCMVKINCKKHGQFEQKNYIHAMKSGCQNCADENRLNGYSRSDFNKNAKGRECILYVLRCFDEHEEFYKVGITFRTVKKRYCEKLDMPYNYELLYEYKSFDGENIWDLELFIKNKYKTFKFKPIICFKGQTECLSIKTPINEIKNYLNSLA